MILTTIKILRKIFLDLKTRSQLKHLIKNDLKQSKKFGQAVEIQICCFANCAAAELISQKTTRSLSNLDEKYNK